MSNKKRRREMRLKEESEKRRRLVLTTLAIIVVGIGLGMLLVKNPGSNVEVDEASFMARQPVLGDEDAPVTLVAFVDFKCPHCRTFHTEVAPRIKEEFVRTGQVRMVLVNFPFLAPDSRNAALAIETMHVLDPESVWELADAIFASQGNPQIAWATPDLLATLATNVSQKVNYSDFRRAIRDRQFKDEVDLDIAYANQMGVRGTPSVFINGEYIPDWSFASLAYHIRRHLTETVGASQSP